jgi:hypothetical protein
LRQFALAGVSDHRADDRAPAEARVEPGWFTFCRAYRGCSMRAGWSTKARIRTSRCRRRPTRAARKTLYHIDPEIPVPEELAEGARDERDRGGDAVLPPADRVRLSKFSSSADRVPPASVRPGFPGRDASRPLTRPNQWG